MAIVVRIVEKNLVNEPVYQVARQYYAIAGSRRKEKVVVVDVIVAWSRMVSLVSLHRVDQVEPCVPTRKLSNRWSSLLLFPYASCCLLP